MRICKSGYGIEYLKYQLTGITQSSQTTAIILVLNRGGVCPFVRQSMAIRIYHPRQLYSTLDLNTKARYRGVECICNCPFMKRISGVVRGFNRRCLCMA